MDSPAMPDPLQDEPPRQLDAEAAKPIEQQILAAGQSLEAIKQYAEKLISKAKPDQIALPKSIDQVLRSLKAPGMIPHAVSLFLTLDHARQCVAQCNDVICANDFAEEQEIEFLAVNDTVLMALVLIVLFTSDTRHNT